jgi:hypothetical protein
LLVLGGTLTFSGNLRREIDTINSLGCTLTIEW